MARTTKLVLRTGAAFAVTVSWLSVSYADDAAIEHGRQLFMANNCYLCHGTVGQGGAGPRITPPPPNPAFTAFVRHPRPDNMPPYTASVISDADLQAIQAYLASLPLPSGSLPDLLSQTLGPGSK